MRLNRPRAAALAVAALAALSLAHGALAYPDHHAKPLDRSHRVQVGKASYFGTRATGRTTASGKPVRAGKLTAASRTLPLGTKAKVTDLDTGKSVHVVVTDRGPFAKHRILDVSPKAAGRLGMKSDGVATVQVRPLKEPTPTH